MEEILDLIWFKIEGGIQVLKLCLDALFSPLTILGPAVMISVIALLTVLLTRFLAKTFKTKRYRTLEKEFNHWHGVRQAAMAADDREKGRLVAKSIDKAKLNRLYYDYFLEGLLNNMGTRYIPILFMIGYVNEAFNPHALLKTFGRNHVVSIPLVQAHGLEVGGIFWFVVSIVSFYLLNAVRLRLFSKNTDHEGTELKSSHPASPPENGGMPSV